ncbi:LysE family translocator [Desulfuromonas versatilis]|nr:LysE family translocator [Desulfuromonas versatilis]
MAILLAVAGLWAVAVVTPGPNALVVARIAMAETFAGAWFATLGICSGTICWGAAGFFGISLLFTCAPWLYLGLKVCGGAYLVFLGIRSLAAARRGCAQLDGESLRRRTAPGDAWRLGLVTNLTNPKTAAFVGSLFAASLPPDPPLWVGLLCIGLMAAISLAWYSLLAWLLSGRRCATAYARGRHWIERCAGLIFIAFGLRLASGR